MINYQLILICSYSIAIAVIIGLARFRKITHAYQPFIFITIAALVNELTSNMLIRYYKSNAISVNILNICQSLLWIWQFQRWGGFSRSQKWVLPTLLGGVVLFWIVENLVLMRIVVFSSVFSLVSSFVLLFLAINQVNRLIVEERGNLLRNSKFLICSGLLIFHAYKIMVDSFYVMKLNESNEFLSNIVFILVFVNLFVNLLYALATLWIPTRQRFTMQY